MLATSPIIGFVPTNDPGRARAFYEVSLGLEFVLDDGFALIFQAGGNMIRVVRAGAFTPLPFTILGWEVPDVAAAAAALSAAGVTFERYPFLPAEQVDGLGVWTSPNGSKVAWFKDPDGNTLSLSHHGAL